jgi:hypothetical protein
VKLDEMLDDRQAKTQPTVVAALGLVGLAELIEDVRQKVRGDALTVIGHGTGPRPCWSSS